tara:strand:+ start:243 stop:2972 length:2730 start_codon:yes stop_codon:yes gene_type:complete
MAKVTLGLNEIKRRALEFSKEFEDAERESGESQIFWHEFFKVFGRSSRAFLTYEKAVKQYVKDKTIRGRIDAFWKGTLLIEHKSKGKDLDSALEQGMDYFHGLHERDLPRYVIVSDFERIRLVDLDKKVDKEILLKNLYKNVELFRFISGYTEPGSYGDSLPVNVKGAKAFGDFYIALKETGYSKKHIETYLVRILFCLYADNASVFEDAECFRRFIDLHTHEDGSDLGGHLALLFQVLNEPEADRSSTLEKYFEDFPYINGGLFSEIIPIASFNLKLREMLLNLCSLDWAHITPAIFGSMMQHVMDPKKRRDLGAHYTTETNIKKVIDSLFLDDLYAEFNNVKASKKNLIQFHEKIGELNFLDPACGCGNFLITAYKHLRKLENDILLILNTKKDGTIQKVLEIGSQIKVDVNQLHGIEIDHFPVKIAETSVWLMEHKMNLELSEKLGIYYKKLPITSSANIFHENAIKANWDDLFPKSKMSYIFGNPPFVGTKSPSQTEDCELLKISKKLDYAAAWYIKSAEYIQETDIKVGFVTTNSITRGQQVEPLWKMMYDDFNVNINFAHQTFKWSNEASKKAAVHVVIIGFWIENTDKKLLFRYGNVNDKVPEKLQVKEINPYLLPLPKILIPSRQKPPIEIPKMRRGFSPYDDQNLLFDEAEYKEFIKNEPGAKSLIKPIISGNEFLEGEKRYCLWLHNISPAKYKNLPMVLSRIKAVQKYREGAKGKETRKYASTPSVFRSPKEFANFIVVPRHTSENRPYIPMAFYNDSSIPHDSIMIVPNGDLFLFGIMMSSMHMVWVDKIGGKLESRYRYSSKLVYNNFPWPINVNPKKKITVEKKAKQVLDARAAFPDMNLKELYEPVTMPPKLVKAHQELNKAVDLCYRSKKFIHESARISFLFDKYQEYISKDE